MATANPFDLLGDDDNDDPSQLIAAQQQKFATKKPAPAAAATPASAKLPAKPVPPAQAVREARSNTTPGRGGGGFSGGRGGPGRGRGGRGSAPGPRDYGNGNVSGFTGGYGGSGAGEDGDSGKPSERERGPYGAPRQPYHGGRRGGYGNEEVGGDSDRPPPRRVFERRSGTGRGNELKREGSGRGNWGIASDEVFSQVTEEAANTEDKVLALEKQPEQEGAPAAEASKENKEGAADETEEKEPEDKEMTLEEYEKIREEKRKALLAMKAEERKVNLDKEFESMKQLSLKKEQDDVFIKLGSDKDSKRKDNADRDDRVKKSVSINEFLKPAEGERYYSPGGRGRGRGRSDRGFSRGGFSGSGNDNERGNIGTAAPLINDPGHFPTLGGKQ